MIDILLGDVYLDTSGVTLSVTLRSPVFNKDKASFIYSVSLPATDKNLKALDFFPRIESTIRRGYDYSVKIFCNHVFLWEATLRAKLGSSREIQADLVIERGDFNYNAKNRLLTDVTYDALQYSLEEKAETNSILKVPDQAWPEAKFAYFPVYNPSMYKGSWFDQFFNMSIDQFRELVFSVDHMFLFFMSGCYFDVLRAEGLIADYVDGDGTQHTYLEDWDRRLEEYKNISDRYSNALQEHPNYIYHFYYWFLNRVAFFGLEAVVASKTRILNDFWAAGWINYININFLNHTYTPGKHIVPFPYLCEVIKGSFEDLGYSLSKNFFAQDSELASLCILTMNCANVDYGGIFPASDLKTINLNEHLPEISISDFCKSIEEFFNATVIVDRKRSVSVIRNQDMLSSHEYIEWSAGARIMDASFSRKNYRFHLNNTADDWFSSKVKQEGVQRFNRIADVWAVADLPDPWTQVMQINVVCWVGDHQMFYITTMEDDFIWKPYSKKDFDLFVDESHQEEEQVSPDMGYLIKQEYGWYAGDDANIFLEQGYDLPYFEFPRCAIQGNNLLHAVAFDTEYSSLGLKLMFYRGWKHFSANPLANADELPHGSADDTYLGSPIAGLNYSLLWDGENGIYEKFWEEWIYWRNNIAKQVRITKVLSVAELAGIDWTAKYRIHGMNYFIVEIRVNLGDVVSPAEIDLISC